MSLFCFTFLTSILVFPALGELQEFVIDDSDTGSITYDPPESWQSGSTCAGCTSAPDISRAYANTWHVSTSSAAYSTGAIITFEGVEVSITSFVASSHLPGLTNTLQFFLDDAPPNLPSDRYTSSPDSENDWELVEVYRATGLNVGWHTLRIQNGYVGGPTGVMFLDKVAYVKDVLASSPNPKPPGEEPEPSSESATTTSTSTSTTTTESDSSSSCTDDSNTSTLDAATNPSPVKPATTSTTSSDSESSRPTTRISIATFIPSSISLGPSVGSLPPATSSTLTFDSTTTSDSSTIPVPTGIETPPTPEADSGHQPLRPGIIAAIVIASLILLTAILLLLCFMRYRRRGTYNRSARPRPPGIRRGLGSTADLMQDYSRGSTAISEKSLGAAMGSTSPDSESQTESPNSGWDFRGGPTPDGMRVLDIRSSAQFLPGATQCHSPLGIDAFRVSPTVGPRPPSPVLSTMSSESSASYAGFPQIQEVRAEGRAGFVHVDSRFVHADSRFGRVSELDSPWRDERFNGSGSSVDWKFGEGAVVYA